MKEKNVYATDQEFLEWFFCNADFGPADGDVRLIMMEEFEEQTGKLVPPDYRPEE